MIRYYVPKTRDEFINDSQPVLEEHEERENGSLFSLSSMFSLFSFLISLVFLGFLIYAIFKYNTDEVRTVCPSLMIFIIIRTVVALIVLASLATFIRCNVVGNDSYFQSNLPGIILTSSLVYFMAFCVSGGFVVSQSMIDNAKCTDILNDSIFKVPLLGILGWIYVTCDGLFTLLFAYIFITNYFISSSERDPNVNEENELILHD